jgi:hypothetical protein
MKKLMLSLLLVAFALSMSAQSDFYVTLWYGQVKNSDAQSHIEIEREYYTKMWKEQINQGNIMGWDMWQIINPDVNEMTTTFIYVTLHNTPSFSVSPVNSIPGKSDKDWQAAQKEAMSHYVKNYSVVTSVKGGYGPQMGGTPPEYAVINYMEVDPYRAAEYERAELEDFMPAFKENDKVRKGWGLHKVLNHYGTENPINYVTVDFYDSYDAILMARDNTGAMSEEDMAFWKKFDEVRTLADSHIIRLVQAVR